MANEKITTQLDFPVDDSSVKGFVNLLGKVGKEFDKINKNLVKAQKESEKELKAVGSAVNDIGTSYKKLLKEFEGKGSLKNIFKDNQKEIDNLNNKMGDLGKLQAEMAKAEYKGNKEKAKQVKEQYEQMFQDITGHTKELSSKLQSQSEDIKKTFVKDREELNKYFKKELPDEMGKGIGSAVKGALDADTAGIMTSLSGIVGGALTAGAKKFSQARKERQVAREMDPTKGPGLLEKAKNVPVLGKGMGGITKMLGSLVKMLGPITMAVGGVAMLVKLFIDAEAQTIDLNKALTDSTSLLRLGEGNAELATKRMDELREAATDFRTNIRLGLDPKQHFEVLGALEQHHAGINRLSKGYHSFGDAATDIVTTVRHASLNLATDMGSVAEFIGQMTDIHGKELPIIQSDLQHIVGAAEGAQISTKDFFSTVSQVTGQMGLYNYRLEDTTFLMGELSHLMDAENAKEFATAMTTGMKDMNGEERLRLMYLAGQQKVQEMITEESERMYDSVTETPDNLEDINKALEATGRGTVESASELEEVLSDMRDSGEDFPRFLSHLRGENEDLANNVGKASDMAEQVSKGGLLAADAMGELQAIDQLEIQMGALEEVFSKPLDQISSLEASRLGVDEQQLRVMQRLDQNARGQLARFQEVEEAFKEGDPEAQNMLDDLNEQFGMSIEKEEIIAGEIQNRHDLMRRMSEDEKEELRNQTMSAEEAAREQVIATQSVADILKTIVAGLLNNISEGVMGISRMLLELPGIGDDRPLKQMELGQRQMDLQRDIRDLTEEQETAAREGNEEMARSIGEDIERLEREESLTREANELLDNEQNNVGQIMSSLRTALDFETVNVSQVAAAEQAARDKHGTPGWQEALGGEKISALMGMVNPMAGLINSTGVFTDLFGGNSNWAQDFGQEWAAGIEQQERGNQTERARTSLGEMLSDENDLIEPLVNGEELSEEQNDKLDQLITETSEDTGIDRETITRLAREQAEEMNKVRQREAAIQDLMEMDFNRGEAEAYISDVQSGRLHNDWDRKSEWDAKLGDNSHEAGMMLHRRGLTETEDARILSGGFAPHLFAPGDMVIKADEIANTMTGKAGQFVPDLLQAMDSGGAGARGGSGMNMHNVFNINGGNTQEVENTILRVLEMAERKRYGES